MSKDTLTSETAVDNVTISRRNLLKGAVLGSAGTVLAGFASKAESQIIIPDAAAQSTGVTHEYWISADSFEHNVVPNGFDGTMGIPYTADQTTFWALGYRAYTPNWKSVLPSNNATIGANTGIPGPVIRGAVGDTIIVHFRNNDTYYGFPHSIHPHGVFYSPLSDGAWNANYSTKAGTAVPVGESYVYTYTVIPSSVGTWVYHDHSIPQGLDGQSPVMEMGAELGLFGLFALTDANTPKVDQEFILFFHDIYAADIPSLAQDLDCFNGQSFINNTPTFTAKVGEKIRWRIGALGKEFHVFHLHAHRWQNQAGAWTDTQHIGPAMSYTIEYVEDNPGLWLYHCHVTDHMMGGMMGLYYSYS